MERHPALCALSDARAGNQRQACALASALAGDGGYATRTLQPSTLARLLAPRTWPGLARPFGDALDVVPGLAIGCGRQAALATRLLRARGSQVVQLLDPRIDPSHWNLVIAPRHDHLRGDNVIETIGSLHPVDDAWLERARAQFQELAAMPQPRTVLLLGGPSRHAGFDRVAVLQWIAQLRTVCADQGGSLLVTASRRTPPEIVNAIANDTAGIDLVWRGAQDGANPYAGLLAFADRIVCSPDSVNMISEACATRVPVFVAQPQHAQGRIREFIDALLQSGRVRTLDARLLPFEVAPLRETARVAQIVRERLDWRACGE